MTSIVVRSLKSFSIFLLKTTRWTRRHSRWTIGVFAVLTVFLFFQLGKTKIVFSAEDLAGQGLASADELKDIKARYNDGYSSVFMLTPAEGKFSFTDAELCAIRKWYSFVRFQIPDLKQAVSSFNFKWPVQIDDKRVFYRNLLDLDCADNKLNTSAEDIYQKLNRAPFGLAVENRHALSLSFQFVYKDSTSSKFGSFDPAAVEALRTSVDKELLPQIAGARVSWFGPADYQWYILEGFKFSKFVNLAMLVFLFLSLSLVFGRWLTGGIYIFSLMIGAVWVFGFKALVGSSFDVMSTGLMLIIGISSLEDFVFISAEQMKGRTWSKSIRTMMVPGFFTSLTTMIGFLSLVVSDVEMVRRMGIWAAWGSFAEWIILFVLIPAVLTEFKQFKSWVAPQPPRLFLYFRRLSFRAIPAKVSWAALAIYPLAILFLSDLNFNEAPHKIFPAKQEYSRSISDLTESKAWVGNLSLLFDQPIAYQKAEKYIQELLSDPWVKDFVVRYESPQKIIDWVTSLKVLDAAEIETHFEISPVKEQFVDEDGRPRALLYVRDSSADPIQDLKQKVARICSSGECHLGGEIVAHSDFTRMVPKTLMDSLVASLFLVGGIIFWLAVGLRKTRLVLSLVVSAFWGPLCILMVLGLFHSTIDAWKSIFASILVGLTGDNAIQYLYGSRKGPIQNGIADRAAASIITGILMALTSLVYLGSYFSPPKTFGIILCSGLFVSLIGDLWILKGLLPKSKS